MNYQYLEVLKTAVACAVARGAGRPPRHRRAAACSRPLGRRAGNVRPRIGVPGCRRGKQEEDALYFVQA